MRLIRVLIYSLIGVCGCRMNREPQVLSGPFNVSGAPLVIEVNPHFKRSANMSVCLELSVPILDPLRRDMPDGRQLQFFVGLNDESGRRIDLSSYEETRVRDVRMLCLYGIMQSGDADVVSVDIRASHELLILSAAIVASNRK